MKRFHVTNIKYDMSDSAGELSPEEGISLPKTMDVYCESEEKIADTISDEMGWLVETFNIEYVE